MVKNYLEKIVNKIDLTREEASDVLENIIEGTITPTQAGALLTALRMKEESIEEIVGFVETMEKHMVKVKLDEKNAIDMCGTGGDGSYSFNVSTTAALVVAAGGVSVAKHGNRSISSKCGSADVLEQLGVKVDLSPELVKKCVDETKIGFFFAPLFHPAMKMIAPVRKSLEMRTVFNMLGPLLNPACVRRQLVGTFDLNTANKIARVLSARKYLKACTVHSADGLDEVSPFSDNFLFEVSSTNGGLKELNYSPKLKPDLHFSENIRGNSPKQNAQITLNVLSGQKDDAREITAVNAAFGFYVSDRVNSVEEGISFAEELIDSGKAQAKLNEFIQVSNDLHASV